MSNTTRPSNLETAVHPEKLHRVAIDPISQLLKGQGLGSQLNLAAEIISTMTPLTPNELRQARGLSQKMLADVLHVQQPSIAKLEKRTDMYLSTLRSHIEAMGGQLEVGARFPDGAVKISNSSDLERKATV